MTLGLRSDDGFEVSEHVAGFQISLRFQNLALQALLRRHRGWGCVTLLLSLPLLHLSWRLTALRGLQRCRLFRAPNLQTHTHMGRRSASFGSCAVAALVARTWRRRTSCCPRSVPMWRRDCHCGVALESTNSVDDPSVDITDCRGPGRDLRMCERTLWLREQSFTLPLEGRALLWRSVSVCWPRRPDATSKKIAFGSSCRTRRQ